MSPESTLRKGLKELSLSYSDEQIAAFLVYLSELKKWNRAYNLTGLKTDEDIVIKHFLDSLLYLRGLPEGEMSVMDAGSGAGFPGIPIKIIRPEITMYLVEPSGKKAGFLIHMIKTLNLDKIEVIEKRIEEVKSLTVDVAVTRALFDLKEFYRKASPCVGEGGLFILSKGPKVQEELKTVEDMKCELLPLKLPGSNLTRFIITIRKKASSVTHRASDSRPAKQSDMKSPNICINIECRLRKAGCRGFEGCPGYKAKEITP